MNDPLELRLNDVLKVEATPPSLAADGVSRAELVAQLQGDTPDGVTVIFRVAGGRLVGSADADGRSLAVRAVALAARATFVAGTDIGVADVVAMVDTFAVGTTVQLVVAEPTKIVLTPDRTSATADGSAGIQVTARLLRPDGAGWVSKGTIVTFSAVDSVTGQDVADLRALVPLSDPLTGTVVRTITSRTARTLYVIAAAGTAPIVADTATVAFKP